MTGNPTRHFDDDYNEFLARVWADVAGDVPGMTDDMLFVVYATAWIAGTVAATTHPDTVVADATAVVARIARIAARIEGAYETGT